MIKPSFKSKYSPAQRYSEAKRILRKYPDRIPVIAELSHNSSLTLDKTKYLVPCDLSVGQFIYVIRKRLNLPPEKAIFLFTENNTLPPTGSLMSNVYEYYRDTDLFLYFIISEESVFG